MPTNQRPAIVSVIGWFLIVFGLLRLFISVIIIGLMPRAQEAIVAAGASVPTAIGVMAVVAIVALAAGAGVLYGISWSRFLVPLTSIFAIAARMALYGHVFGRRITPFGGGVFLRLALGIVAFIVLMVPPASEYFRNGRPHD